MFYKKALRTNPNCPGTVYYSFGTIPVMAILACCSVALKWDLGMPLDVYAGNKLKYYVSLRGRW